MTRGKHGASMARSRAEAASAEVERLRQELKEERQTHHADVQALKTELTRLRSEIRTEAERLAADGIAAAQEETAEAVRAGQELHDNRVAAVVAALRGPCAPKDPGALTMRQWAELADALGVNASDLSRDDAVTTRASRRMPNGKRKFVSDLISQNRTMREASGATAIRRQNVTVKLTK